MTIFFPISIGTILIVGLIILSPIINLGMRLEDTFLLLHENMAETFLKAFLIFLVIAIIFLIITKDFGVSISIFLNIPIVLLFPLYEIADFYAGCNDDGFIWTIFTSFLFFLFHLLAWGIVILIAVILIALNFGLWFDMGKDKRKKIVKSDSGLSLLFSVIGVAVQAGLFFLTYG